jgi:hypothetical protein
MEVVILASGCGTRGQRGKADPPRIADRFRGRPNLRLILADANDAAMAGDSVSGVRNHVDRRADRLTCGNSVTDVAMPQPIRFGTAREDLIP